MKSHFSSPTKNFFKIFSLVILLIATMFVAKGQAPIITTFAGTTPGYSGDGGLATAAKLNQPSSAALDAAGNVYIADSYNNVIRKVNISTGIITTVAGNGTQGYSGDGGAATSAQLNAPQSIAIDATDNLYIGDWANNVIRKVNLSTGIITTFAGTGVAGYSGDGGLATAAQLNLCSSVAFDLNGNVYITDFNNQVIRKVDNAGIITTFAGTGSCGYSGDGGPAIAAQLCAPLGMQNDVSGNLYISDIGNTVVRKIDVSTGIISTVAGNGTTGYSGDGGPATSAQLNANFDVTVDNNGNLFIADFNNNVIRKVNTSGIISTYAGNGTGGLSGDGGPATSAQLLNPMGVKADVSGNLYIADWSNNRVRKVSVPIISSQDCNSSINFPVVNDSTVCLSHHINKHQTEAWYQFTATNANMNFTILNIPSVNSNSSVGAVAAYSGTCAALLAQADSTIINGDTINTFLYSLSVGQTYYLKLTKVQTCISCPIGNGKASYNICSKIIPSSPLLFNCPVGACTLINETFTFPALTAANSDPFSSGSVNCWDKAWCTPQVVGNCALMGSEIETPACAAINNAFPPIPGTNSQGEAIMRNMNIVPNNYLNQHSIWILQYRYAAHYATGQDQFNVVLARKSTSGLPIPVGPSYCVIPPIPGFLQVDQIPFFNNQFPNFLQRNRCFTIPTSDTLNQLILFPRTVTAAPCTVQGTRVDDIILYEVKISKTGHDTICKGDSVQLGATGCTIPHIGYLWTPSAGLSCSTCANPWAHPTSTTVYTLTVTDSAGVAGNWAICSVSNVDTITVLTNTVTVSPNPSLICTGTNSSVTLTATSTTTGTNSYTWTPSSSLSTSTGSVVIASPTITTIYTVNDTFRVGPHACHAKATATVNVAPTPVVTITSNTTTVYCSNISHPVILTAHGGTTYTWSTGATTAVITLQPTVTTTYTVTGSTGGCSNSTTITITVNQAPIFVVSPISSTICVGQSVTVTVNNPTPTYSWVPSGSLSSSTGTVVTASPTVTTHYTVTGTSAAGCQTVHTATIIVNPLPNILLTGNSSICSNTVAVLHASGAGTGGTYTLSPLPLNTTTNTGLSTATYTVNPSITTVYTLTGTNSNGCKNTSTFTVAVGNGPVLSMTQTSFTNCAFNPAYPINANVIGAVNGSHTWTANPAGSTSVFTFTCLPSIECSSVNLAAVGTTTYTYTNSGANGCPSSITFTVVIAPLTPPTVSGPICSGGPASVAVTNTVSTYTYSWSPSTGTNSVSCLPSTPICSQVTINNPSGTYTVFATNTVNGCKSKTTISTSVPPTITVASQTLCLSNNTATVTLSGGSTNYTVTPAGQTYTTSTGSVTYTVAPTSTTVYTVTGTNAASCSTVKTFTITIKPTPIVTANNPTICVGMTATLTASGATSFHWTGGVGNPTLSTYSTNTYTSAGTYTNVNVVGTSAGCMGALTTVTITVVPSPTISVSVTTPTVNGCNTIAPSNSICVGSSAILTATSAGSVTWNPGGLSGLNVSVTPTITTTYTATTNNGSCTATKTITIIVSTCPCTGGPPLPTSGTFTTGTFVLNGNQSISGICNLTNVTVLCGTNATLTVQPAATLNISGSHVYACNTMWKGITVMPRGTINVTNNSLIEDGIIAIGNGGSATNITSGSPPIINIVNSVFNCNRISVREAFYQSPNPANYTNAQFQVVNSVFTCRCNITYPIISSQLRALTNTVTNTPNPSQPDLSDYYSVGNLISGNLKIPFSGQPALIGIDLQNDGISLTTAPSPVFPATVDYTYQLFGGQLNIFDNHVYGINAVNSSLEVTLAAFQFPRQTGNPPLFIPSIGGYGINAINTIPDRYDGIYVHQDRFINMVRAIHTINYFDIELNNTNISSRQTITPFGSPPLAIAPQGNYGMFVKTVRFMKVNIKNNNIANVDNGIDFLIDKSAGYNGANGEYVGPVSINNNMFTDQFTSTSYFNRYIGTAIVADNIILPPFSPGPVYGGGSQIQIKDNQIYNAFNGILARNHQYQEVRDENNIITLQVQPTVTFTPTQAGIEHDHVIFNNGSGAGNDIYNNTITGTGFTGSFGNPSVFEPKKGIFCNLTANHYVTCNNVNTIGRGFDFSGLNTPMFWRLNNMTSCGEGYVLSSNSGGGVIGTQGANSDGSDNYWTPSTFSAINPETFVDLGNNANTSILYVRGAAAGYLPSFNSGGGLSYINPPFPSANLLNASSGSTSYNCGQIPPAIIIHPNNSNLSARGSNNSTTSSGSQLNIFEKIAQDSLSYPVDSAQNSFINKNMLYRMIKADTNLLDSSSILRTFFTNNAGSSWALYCAIDDSLYNQNYSYVNSLLSSYNPTFNIEQNYKRFYQIYINGLSGNATANDTVDLETLAASCPRLNGAVVYQARAFHNSYYLDYKHYEDNCPNNEVLSREKNPAQVKNTPDKLKLNFYPNPTTGIVYVSVNDGGNHVYQAKIYDVSGKLVLKQDLHFENGISRFKLDAENGVYILNLFVNENETPSIYKIIVNK